MTSTMPRVIIVSRITDIIGAYVGLSDSKKLFFEIRNTCIISVRRHAFIDYPERGFTRDEIITLVRSNGNFKENDSLEAINGSFLFFPIDSAGKKCKLVILIEKIIKRKKERIIVCSAYRSKK